MKEKRSLKKTIIDFYTKEKSLDVSLFKLLGTGGIAVSLTGAIQDMFTSSDLMGTVINLLAALASVILMWFVHTTRKYIVGYLITSVVVFMALFAWLFLETGAMLGSIPYFFSFGIVFTLLMYKGALLWIMEVIQILFYTGVCWFSYKYPEYVAEFETPEKQFYDQLAGIILAAIGIGMVFMMYIREYRKQQKIAEESSNAKSILLANISHEIRTPINMLLGMNEMILRESENSQINEYAQNVDNAGQHLLFMVNQFLDLSRIDMGKEELFEEDFNMKKVISSLGSFFGKEAEKKGLEFVMDIDKNIPVNFYGDSRKLTQIISNLLSNAIKYTSKGTVVFTARTIDRDQLENSGEGKEQENKKTRRFIKNQEEQEEKDEKYYIHFEVSDTGNGIAEEDQKKIFESFERVDIIRNRSIEGTGLGLAISNKLANLMGSEIKVSSQYGLGSVFWFDIGLQPGKESESHFDADALFIAPEAKILVVDDNDMNLQVAKSLLKRTMAIVDTAESAVDAFKKCENRDYDLILMDYMMPEIDGIEAMDFIRKLDAARNKRTPILVLTADATPDKKEFFLNSGFDDYLLKPIDTSLLENAMKKHLPKKLVIVVSDEVQKKLPEETKEKLGNILKTHDISIELALKHLSGDILQYARVCGFFLENSGENISKLNAYMEKKDYKNAAILVHAIKGNVGNVGGEDLYYSARRLEKRLKDRDEEYAVSALPLFIMKWNRVDRGLKEFLDEFEKVKPLLELETEVVEETEDEKDIWDELLEAVSMGNQSPALKLIDRLMPVSSNKDVLLKVQEHIRNIEFDEAEELLKKV